MIVAIKEGVKSYNIFRAAEKMRWRNSINDLTSFLCLTSMLLESQLQNENGNCLALRDLLVLIPTNGKARDTKLPLQMVARLRCL